MSDGFAAPAPRALVFDLDGTLIDSAPDLHASLNRTLAACALPPLPLERVASMVGDGARKLVERAVIASGRVPFETETDAMLARFLADYTADPVRHTRAYPGVAETLSELQCTGWRLGVCTNKPLAPTLAILDALALRGYFDAVIGGDGPRKPDPRSLLAVLAQMRCAPENAILIGDGEHDLLAARAAGARFLGVTYGYGRGSLKRHASAVLVDAFDQIPDFVERCRMQ